MIGDRVRALRRQRSWTQTHLASAAGLSLRTVQRLERLHSCSSETLRAIAAALTVDLTALVDGVLSDPDPSRFGVSHRVAGIVGTLLALPAVTFVPANLVRSWLHFRAPLEWLDRAGEALRLPAFFDQAAPFLLLGGPLVAIAINLAAQFRLTARFANGEWHLTGIRMRLRWTNSTVVLLASAALLALVAYEVLETTASLAAH